MNLRDDESVTVDTMQQAALTREEGTKMATEFNHCLAGYAAQVDELAKQNKILSEKFEKEANRNDSIRDSIGSLKYELERIDSEIETKQKEFSLLEEKIFHERTSANSMELKFNLFKLDEVDDMSLDEVLEMCTGASEYYAKLERESIVLGNIEELLGKQTLEAKSKNNAEMRCVNCGKTYILAENNKGDCIFHPGSLRYFSCRGCGADAYYNCCSKCKKCSSGCKITNHSS